MSNSKFAVGVDGCKGGWIAVIAPEKDFNKASAILMTDVQNLKELIPGDAEIIVDMPIGLELNKPHRLCDVQGRQYLGNRRSTLFSPPCLSALNENSYENAKEVNKKYTGIAFSKQSWFLKEKILEVREAVRKGLPLKEGHPECSFGAYKGKPLANGKKSLKGILERLSYVTELGFNVNKVVQAIDDPEELKIDDLLDAMILCWTAVRIMENRHFSFPKGIREDRNHFDCRIFV